jgi:hypothetical protein
VAACQQRRRVRFATVAELVNELNEARQKNEINRVVNRDKIERQNRACPSLRGHWQNFENAGRLSNRNNAARRTRVSVAWYQVDILRGESAGCRIGDHYNGDSR